MSKQTGSKASDAKASDRARLNRRGFFLLGGSAAAAAAVPLAAKADSETGAEKTKARYRETEEVKTFYRVNRY
ncbi:hypothetical protein [Bradyrhizobium sp. LHD-71]|uniref:hypothetical protein n=1 Tax=Bradyrhizobium sp. LHD-71 TaxID=3072141 RepID=UPI00280C72FB|nr:hypothetical protein [Bradyrhizobium sp. LHD-71]MDQ8731436.1 hypothetical protein [Bradyrhizobium sp. LHD-71]